MEEGYVIEANNEEVEVQDESEPTAVAPSLPGRGGWSRCWRRWECGSRLNESISILEPTLGG